MAVFVRHGLFKTSLLITRKNIYSSWYATKAEKRKGIDRKVGPKIDSSAQSIAAKGFLRPQKEYTPPSDLDNRLHEIFKSVSASTDLTERIDDVEKKFVLMNACFKQFRHGVPNSLLHTIATLSDLKTFYETPVRTSTPLDKMKEMELPPNLHIQTDYHRFHPDTDTMFSGRTAFPRSSTLVTGLKYKNKYKGHTQATQWPYTS